MAYYEPQGWQAPVRQGSWEQPAPPSRSGTSSTAQREDTSAFASQFDEVDRALDNLMKSGKLFNSFPRRDSVPVMVGRPPYADYDPRMMGGMAPPRHHSISDYENIRPHSASNPQGFYAAQRYQGRPNEAEQMMQAKRRLAAQRERDLRNYHQEQQYNRSLLAEISGNKSERSMSPAMSEESRRDLIARQHRALYGNDTAALVPGGALNDDAQNQPSGAPTITATAARVHSPRGVDPFSPIGSDNVAKTPALGGPQSPSRANSTASPGSNANQPQYGIFESTAGQQQQPPTSNSSPGGPSSESPNARHGITKPSAAAVGPIGSRPVPVSSQAPNPALNKRSTTPIPSPLSYGFSPNDAMGSAVTNNGSAGNDKMPPISNPSQNPTATTTTTKDSTNNVGLAWPNGNGVWGSKNGLGVQASVWG